VKVAIKEIRRNNYIATLRKARTSKKCSSKCGMPIELGQEYYEVVIGGGGLGNLKFPGRCHIGCLDKYLGGQPLTAKAGELVPALPKAGETIGSLTGALKKEDTLKILHRQGLRSETSYLQLLKNRFSTRECLTSIIAYFKKGGRDVSSTG